MLVTWCTNVVDQTSLWFQYGVVCASYNLYNLWLIFASINVHEVTNYVYAVQSVQPRVGLNTNDWSLTLGHDLVTSFFSTTNHQRWLVDQKNHYNLRIYNLITIFHCTDCTTPGFLCTNHLLQPLVVQVVQSKIINKSD